jgi:exonuclease VII small subunit
MTETAPVKDVTTLSFEEAMGELEHVVRQLEEGRNKRLWPMNAEQP